MSSLAMPDQSKLVVEIIAVEIDQRIAHVKDKMGGLTKATFRDNSGLALVPATGERWIAERSGWQLHLVRRLDSAEDDTTREEGDAVLSIEGTFRLAVGGFEINSQPLGATVRDVFYPSGSVASWTLSAPPVHEHTVMVYYNGLLVDPNLFTLDGRTITFSVMPPTGTFVVYYQRVAGVTSDDAAVVTGKAEIGQTYDDAGTVTGTAKLFQLHDDSATVTSAAVVSAIDTNIHVDSATVISAGGPSPILDTSNQEQAFLYDETQGWVSFQIDVP